MSVTFIKCFQIKKLNSRRVLFSSSTLTHPTQVHSFAYDTFARDGTLAEIPAEIVLAFSSSVFPVRFVVVKNSSLGSCRLAQVSRRTACSVYIDRGSKQASSLRVCTLSKPLEHNLNPIYLPSQRDQNVKTNIRIPRRFPSAHLDPFSRFFEFAANLKGNTIESWTGLPSILSSNCLARTGVFAFERRLGHSAESHL